MARTFELRPHLLPDMPPPAPSAGHKIELSEAQARTRAGDAELGRRVFVLNLFCLAWPATRPGSGLGAKARALKAGATMAGSSSNCRNAARSLRFSSGRGACAALRLVPRGETCLV